MIENTKTRIEEKPEARPSVYTINDWRPEVRSLLNTLRKHGFIILGGHNGEEGFKRDGRTLADFIDNLIACDEAHLRLGHTKTGPAQRVTSLYLVLGNSPGEIVSDYGIPADVEVALLLDKATLEHGDRWENRKQPTAFRVVTQDANGNYKTFTTKTNPQAFRVIYTKNKN